MKKKDLKTHDWQKLKAASFLGKLNVPTTTSKEQKGNGLVSNIAKMQIFISMSKFRAN